MTDRKPIWLHAWVEDPLDDGFDRWQTRSAWIRIDIEALPNPSPVVAHLLAAAHYDHLHDFGPITIEPDRVNVELTSRKKLMDASAFIDRFNIASDKHAATLGALLTVLGAYP